MQNKTEIKYVNSLKDLPGDIIIFDKKNFYDSRGDMSIQFEIDFQSNFKSISLKKSFSLENVGRGLHIQKYPYEITKIISVDQGDIISLLFNVESNILYIFNLSSKDKKTILIPPCYANGYITKTETIYSYLCLGKYNEDFEISYFPYDLLGYKNLNISSKDSLGIRLY